MAKTLKDFLEGYLKVKSADEQKFIDKHVTAKNPDRNGNGDDVFKGSTKTIDRRKDRKGYNPGEDEKVYEALKGNQHKIDANKNGKLDAEDFELLRKKKKVAEEAEQIDELSQDKLMGYRAAAKKQGTDIQNKMKVGGGDWSKDGKDTDTLKKRLAGYKMAGRKVNPGISASVGKAPRVAATEEVQIDELSHDTLRRYRMKAKSIGDNEKGDINYRAKGRELAGRKTYGGRMTGIEKAKVMAKEEADLEEKLNMDKASMGTVVKDFQKSNAPQFKGKSQDKRRVMAIAAKLTAERGGKPLNKEERLQNCLTDISESHQRIMLEVFDKLNEDNKSKFLKACITPDGVDQMLDFAIRHRGE